MDGNLYLDVFNSRRCRHFRERINFGFDIGEFQEKFRLSAAAAEYLLRLIADDLLHDTFRNRALSPQEQLLTALHFLGNGSQYHSIGDMHGISKATVCRVIHKVSTIIVRRLFPQKVRWPSENLDSIPLKFRRVANFPRVAGIIDGTLIPTDAPTINEAAYVDRKGGHSINAMVVCGPDLQFNYASAKWPGSVHDSRVLRNSTLYQKWERDGNSYNHFLTDGRRNI